MNSIMAFIEHFHFIRPLWLLALPIGLVLLYWFSRHVLQQSGWQQVIDQNLLSHLMNNQEQQKSRRSLMIVVLIGWCIACIAAAGPAWQQLKQPVVKKQDALILVMDLSLSMYAEDQKPSRLVQAKRKLNDILAQRKEGLTALIVYSGDAHVVSPLTDDVDTIATMVPALEPTIMPKFGSNLALAMDQAQALLNNSQLQQAQILLLTDEVAPTQLKQAAGKLPSKVELSILAIGTESGAPIPLPQGFLKDKSGNTVIAKLNWSALSNTASGLGINIRRSSFDDSDINALLNRSTLADNQQTQETERQFDLWQDNGHWLSLLLIPMVLLAFRRGWIICLFIMVLPEPSHAFEWKDLWQTKDQQAARAYAEGDTAAAAETFNDPLWQASSAYQNGDYEQALEGFSAHESADALYNRANTLAKMGRLEEALESYEQALQKQPDMTDAQHNRGLVDQLLKQQQQNDQNQQGDSQDEQQNQDSSSEQQNQDQNQQQSQGDQQQEQDGQQQGQQQNQQNPGEEQNAEQQSGSGEQQEQDSAEEQQSGQSQQQQENAEDEQPQSSVSETEQSDGDPSEEHSAAGQPQEMTPLEQEQQQALQQWLRQIPDDPGMLLKNKFQHQYRVNRKNNEHIDKDSDKVW